MRVSHWNDLLSVLISLTANPLKLAWYSSSGMQGSPTPPLSHPKASNATTDTLARDLSAKARIIGGPYGKPRTRSGLRNDGTVTYGKKRSQRESVARPLARARPC